MRKLILLILAINASLLLILGGLFYLSETHPASPGDLLFDAQSIAENERIRLTGDPLRRAEMSFDLVERRLADLMLIDVNKVDLAINAFDKSLTAAIASMDGVPPEKTEALFQQVKNLLVRVDVVLASLKQRVSDQALTNLTTKIKALQAATSPSDLQKASSDGSRTPSVVKPKTVPFLGKDVDHGDFPLYGGHEVDCLKCHVNGEYADTAAACSSCHKAGNKVAFEQDIFKLLVQSTHLDRGGRECDECHVVETWKRVEFAHKDTKLCLSCHADDAPEKEVAEKPKGFLNIDWDEIGRTKTKQAHYPGDCSLCHQDTLDWANWAFTHNQETCQDCHSSNEAFEKSKLLLQNCLRMRTCDGCHKNSQHVENYTGSCTNCHNDVENWKNLQVDHCTYTACLTCHTDDRPAKHYTSICSNCHGTDTWKNSFFVHLVTSDCQSCHNPPVGHTFVGQCGICHTLTGWLETGIAHLQTNCETCHTRPYQHLFTLLPCASCHNTLSWKNYSIMHRGTVACTECHTAPAGHYTGSCEGCHSTTKWTDNSVFHKLSCTNCHSTPARHYPSACVSCHITSSWLAVSYNHNEGILCSSCHKAPAFHYAAECFAAITPPSGPASPSITPPSRIAWLAMPPRPAITRASALCAIPPTTGTALPMRIKIPITAWAATPSLPGTGRASVLTATIPAPGTT